MENFFKAVFVLAVILTVVGLISDDDTPQQITSGRIIPHPDTQWVDDKDKLSPIPAEQK
ncbi:MAG: hypothetical protein GKS00_22740 [Alphaproteobacteria bacterium]|nr:hypothetical protein [Alphaproteobacteria bacterium]